MERLDGSLPPSAEVRAALQRTTVRLAEELHEPRAIAPAWNEFEWRVAMAVAVMHGIAGLLAGRLAWQGPPFWQAFLAEQRAGSAQRQLRVRELLRRLDAVAREAGIALQALKGSVLIGLDIYAAGERPMSDIDLLVRPEQFEAAGRLIESLGHQLIAQIWKHREYVPCDAGEARAFGEHDCNPIKIDLHGRICERLPCREIDITSRVLQPGEEPGLRSYPSAAALLTHLLFHAAGNLCSYGIRLIHLHDIAALAPRMAAKDWAAALGAEHGGDWWLYPVVHLVDRCFPGHVPAAVLERASIACPGGLRRRAQAYRLEEVSISRFDAPALPGVEWTGSSLEALTYLKARLYPGREASIQLRKATQGHAAMRTMAWGRMPRWQRALHWIGGAPPRVITVYSLQQALQHRSPSVTSA